MSQTKFTPGPWEKDETAPYYISAEDGRNIATVHSGLFSNQESKANADLIAFAPDLYDELQKSVEQMLIGLTAVQKLVEKSGTAEVLSKVEKEMMKQIRNANAALAKARGEKTDEQ